MKRRWTFKNRICMEAAILTRTAIKQSRMWPICCIAIMWNWQYEYAAWIRACSHSFVYSRIWKIITSYFLFADWHHRKYTRVYSSVFSTLCAVRFARNLCKEILSFPFVNTHPVWALFWLWTRITSAHNALATQPVRPLATIVESYTYFGFETKFVIVSSCDMRGRKYSRLLNIRNELFQGWMQCRSKHYAGKH